MQERVDLDGFQADVNAIFHFTEQHRNVGRIFEVRKGAIELLCSATPVTFSEPKLRQQVPYNKKQMDPSLKVTPEMFNLAPTLAIRD